MKLGEFEVDALSDGTFALDGGQMFGVVPKAIWQKKMPADARNRVRLGLTCLLIRTGKQNILVETGIGDKFDEKFMDIYSVEHTTTLPDELKKRGLGLDDIDIVVNTHLHFDHCGWNTRRDGGNLVPTFSRARYLVQRGEWEHACNPTERDRASYLKEFFQSAESQTEFLDGDCQIVPGITVEVVPGHTRNMQCVRVESGGQQVYFISDLVPTVMHLRFPWIMSFDLYPVETLANKQRLLPKLAEEEAVVAFPHDPNAPWLRLINNEGEIVTWPVY
jgi:glyoxylase-like metal-dependent hydrolase (beta-lactamase superfamily II)